MPRRRGKVKFEEQGGSGCERVSSSRLRFDGQGGGLKQRKWRWEGAGCRTALGRSAGKKAAVRAYRCGRRTPWQLGSPPLPFAHRGGKNKFWGLGRRPLSGAKSENWWGEVCLEVLKQLGTSKEGWTVGDVSSSRGEGRATRTSLFGRCCVRAGRCEDA